MNERNVYKCIVWLAFFCILASAGVKRARAYLKERETYGFLIEANGDLTSEIVSEFQNLTGILKFEPADTVAVTIRLGVYTLQTELTGVDFMEYCLKWEEAEPKITVNGRLSLFLSEEIFSSFTDKNGYSPTKSQTEKWMQDYSSLKLTVLDENGQEKEAKICGILKWPDNKVCMDKKQMKELFGKSSHTRGGYMKIYGYRNMKRARSILEAAGFVII